MKLNWNKKNKDDKPADVKGVRDMLLRFVKDQLQKFEGGEGSDIHDIQLFIVCSSEERPVYESAVYKNEDDRFKFEMQKIADDYAIDLPEGWLLGLTFTTDFPENAVKDTTGNVAIIVNTNKIVKQHVTIHHKAEIRILTGEAGKPVYEITPASNKINIGRGGEVKLEDSSIRVNKIAFTEDAGNADNRFISRRHAHIHWNEEAHCFMIFADEGGIPPGNKTKIKIAATEQIVKLNATNMGYRLAEGDQVILGESAVIEIRYL